MRWLIIRPMRLADWIKREGITRRDFAGIIGVTPPYITALCDNTVWPGKDVAGRINTATKGEVTPSDFMAPAEEKTTGGV